MAECAGLCSKLEIVSWLPVILLEATAVDLILEYLYFFKGMEQRRLGHIASFVVRITPACNTIAQFTVSRSGAMPVPLLLYVRYVLAAIHRRNSLPIWKNGFWTFIRILRNAPPRSMSKLGTCQWRPIQRDLNDQIIAAYRERMHNPLVRDAVAKEIFPAEKQVYYDDIRNGLGVCDDRYVAKKRRQAR